jgi:hypothetical protein
MNHPNSNFINVDVTDQGERIAFVRGALAAMAWAQGMNAPENVDAAETGCQRLFREALGDALCIAGGQVVRVLGGDTFSADDLARVDHCLTTAREAIRSATSAAVRYGGNG